MQNLAWLVAVFYIISAISLVVAGFLVTLYLGFIVLGIAFLTPAIVLYLELKEGE